MMCLKCLTLYYIYTTVTMIETHLIEPLRISDTSNTLHLLEISIYQPYYIYYMNIFIIL